MGNTNFLGQRNKTAKSRKLKLTKAAKANLDSLVDIELFLSQYINGILPALGHPELVGQVKVVFKPLDPPERA